MSISEDIAQACSGCCPTGINLIEIIFLGRILSGSRKRELFETTLSPGQQELISLKLIERREGKDTIRGCQK